LELTCSPEFQRDACDRPHKLVRRETEIVDGLRVWIYGNRVERVNKGVYPPSDALAESTVQDRPLAIALLAYHATLPLPRMTSFRRGLQLTSDRVGIALRRKQKADSKMI
jgi:hypothetical protein